MRYIVVDVSDKSLRRADMTAKDRNEIIEPEGALMTCLCIPM